MSSKEKMAKGLYNEVDAEMDTDKMKKMHEMETDVAEGKMNSEFEKEILKVLKAKFDLDPTTATIDFGPNGMSIKPVDYRVWADQFTKGRQTGGKDNNNIDAKADKIAAYFNKKYGKNLVAEEGQVTEFAEEGQALITALATLLGVGVPLATSIYKDLKNAKTPEAKKQVMQSLGTSVGGAAGAHLQKPQTTPSLNELRKQVKK